MPWHLSKLGLVLCHHLIGLIQHIDIIQTRLKKILRKLPLPEMFLGQLPCDHGCLKTKFKLHKLKYGLSCFLITRVIPK